MSTSGKSKTPAFTNSIEAYNKETLGDKIRRLTTANVQLITNKMETEKAKVNLEANRARLFNEKNSLITKKKELRTEIIILNATRLSNVLIRGHQNPFLRSIQDKFKAKKPPSFDSLKENFQRFFTKTRYY